MSEDQDLPNLDREITMMPKDIRDDLAEKGRRDLFFFAKGILGYRQMTTHCHKPLCVFHDRNPAKYKITLIPRGTFKTSVITIGKNTQRAVRDPNSRTCIINEVADNAEGFLGTIRQHFENNRVLRALYSEVIPKDFKKTTWNNSALRLNRQWMGPEDTIEAMGVLATLTSHHYTHLAYDDIISEDAVKSPQVMNDTIERSKKFRSLMVDPAHSTLDITGTRWALHDVYSHFIKSLAGSASLFVRGAIGPDGTLLFPELLDANTLASLRSEYGEYMFSCLYMNNPRDVANQDFNVQDLKFWRMSTDEESVVLFGRDGTIEREWPLDKLDITVSVDLALAEKISDDSNAIVTCGTTPEGQAVVLDVWNKHCTPLEVVQRLVYLQKRWRPRQVGIESIMYQKSLKYFLKDECERQGVYMNIIDLKAIPSRKGTGNNTKESRIRGLQPLAATGRLYVLPSQHVLRSQMADFPLGEHDDVLDALAHQLSMWRGLLSPERIRKYKESEARLIQRVMTEGLDPAIEQWSSRHPRDIPHPDDLGIELPQFGNWEEVSIQ